jgi:hypothetical protein
MKPGVCQNVCYKESWFRGSPNMAVLSIAVTVDESLPFWKYLSEKENYSRDIKCTYMLHIKDWSCRGRLL